MRNSKPGLVLAVACLLLQVSACQAIDTATTSTVTTLSNTTTPEAPPTPPVQVAALDFDSWLTTFKQQAVAQGVSVATVESAFIGVSQNARVIELSQRQPEFTKTIWEYLDGAVSSRRIRRGQDLLVQYQSLLSQIEQRYGVPPEYLVAIWGLESDYGRVFGNFNVIEVLATLGYQGRRQDFGREQLLAALRIIDRGDIPAQRMVGSWAGAMGHTQFIPTTFLEYAVDFDGDGKRDLWNSIPDALASAAHYLSTAGRWQAGIPWGYEVKLARSFDWDLIGSDSRRAIRNWGAYGVQSPTHYPLPDLDTNTALIAPAGYRGPAFLVTGNFRAILRYNNATSYALAVGHLGDRLKGVGPFQGTWPRDLEPLSRSDKRDLQRLLTRRGHNPGGVDGIIGPRTRAAIRAYQKVIGEPHDGFPTQELLKNLRNNTY